MEAVQCGFPVDSVLALDILSLRRLTELSRQHWNHRVIDIAKAVNMGTGADKKEWKAYVNEMLGVKQPVETMNTPRGQDILRRAFGG